MKSLIITILFCLLPLIAYGEGVVRLQSADFSGLDIQASPHSTSAFAYVIIENNSLQKVSCEATFRNGPELPKLGLDKAEVEPSATTYLRYISKRPGLVTRINLKCGPMKTGAAT